VLGEPDIDRGGELRIGVHECSQRSKRGVGVAIMMESIGDSEPLVRQALPELPPFPVPMWLATHRELSTSRRLRVVFDALLEGLCEAPLG